MARINWEDSIWSDPRFMKLCVKLGDEEKAAGKILMAWRLAQKCWCPDKLPIPKEKWSFGSDLIEVGLAKESGDGIYMCGSEEHFDWWFKKVNAGKIGGLAKASNAKQLLEFAKQNVPSSSSSSSSSKTIHNTRSKSAVAIAPDLDFEKVYEKYPRKVGKKRGLTTLKSTIKTPELLLAACQAVDNYKSYLEQSKTEPQFIKHFSTFANEWTDWLDASTGKVIGYDKNPTISGNF